MARMITRRAAVRWLCTSVVAGSLAGNDHPPHVAATAGTTLYDLGMSKNRFIDLTAALDGAAWVCDGAMNQIVRVTHDGVMTRFTLPTTREREVGPAIVAAPDGGIWFAEYNAGQIGRVAPDGTVAEYPFAFDMNFRFFTDSLAVGPDSSVWLTETMSKRVGRMMPDGTVSHFPADPPPAFLTAGPDGNMWFTTGTGDVAGTMLGTVTPGGMVSYVPVSIPITGRIIYGPGNVFWVAAGSLRTTGGHYYSQIFRVTPVGIVTSLGLSGNYYAQSIAVRADGNAWVGIFGATGDRIARITPMNRITEYTVPDTGVYALSTIAASPDGDILFGQFSERDGLGRIGRIDPTQAIPTPDTPEFSNIGQ